MFEKVNEIIEKSRGNADVIKSDENALRAMKWSERATDTAAALADEIDLLTIENAILYDNARRVLYDEVMPIICGILKKYEGKPYGGKTRAKMSDELKAAANCAFHISQDAYGPGEVHIIPLDINGYSGGWFRYDAFNVYLRYNEDGERSPQKILIDNKIQSYPPEALDFIFSAKYTENPHEQAKTIKLMFDAVKDARRAFEDACKNINEILPSRIECLNAGYFKNYLV